MAVFMMNESLMPKDLKKMRSSLKRKKYKGSLFRKAIQKKALKKIKLNEK